MKTESNNGASHFGSDCAGIAEVGQNQNRLRTNHVQKSALILSIFAKLFVENDLKLVEAAGVEPASEIVVSQETPCVVTSVISLSALRSDKKRWKLVR